MFLPLLVSLASLFLALLMTGESSLATRWSALNSGIEGHHFASLYGMGAGLMLASTGLLFLFRYSTRLRSKQAQFTIRASVAMQWIAVALFLGVFVSNYLNWGTSPDLRLGVLAGGGLGTLALLVWRQAQAKRFVPPSSELGSDDRWRWGIFYVDRDDPALFVQSRCGSGYSLNYGRMMAWPIAAAIVVYLVAMLFMIPHR